MNTLHSTDKNTLTIERIFNSSLNQVWNAYTNPEEIKQWWSPNGMVTTVVKHDFTVGGEWEFSMEMSNGNAFISDGIYIAIEKEKLLCTTANFKPMTEGVEMQSYFEENEGKTKLLFKVVHHNEEYCKQQKDMGFDKGWNSTFDRLESFLNKTS